MHHLGVASASHGAETPRTPAFLSAFSRIVPAISSQPHLNALSNRFLSRLLPRLLPRFLPQSSGELDVETRAKLMAIVHKNAPSAIVASVLLPALAHPEQHCRQ